MANESRVRGNNAQGTVSDNPLASGALTLNSAGLANLPAVGATEHAILVLDPLRVAGAPEIVLVTAHTGAATSATVTRGYYGTAARSHVSGTLWVHAATIDDLIRIVTSATRPSTPYRGQLIFETDTNSFVARDTSDAWQTVVQMGAWTSYTPTLTQSATVTKTVTYAKWTRFGRTIVAAVSLSVTGAGTAANNILIGLPVTAAVASGPCGSGYVNDSSAVTNYSGTVLLASTTTVGIVAHLGSGFVGGSGAMTAALATADTVTVFATYEAAS